MRNDELPIDDEEKDRDLNLFYIRSSSDPSGKWAAEVCFRGDDKMYTVVEVSDTQLLNFLRVAADIVSKRGVLKLTPQQLRDLG